MLQKHAKLSAIVYVNQSLKPVVNNFFLYDTFMGSAQLREFRVYRWINGVSKKGVGQHCSCHDFFDTPSYTHPIRWLGMSPCLSENLLQHQLFHWIS